MVIVAKITLMSVSASAKHDMMNGFLADIPSCIYIQSSSIKAVRAAFIGFEIMNPYILTPKRLFTYLNLKKSDVFWVIRIILNVMPSRYHYNIVFHIIDRFGGDTDTFEYQLKSCDIHFDRVF